MAVFEAPKGYHFSEDGKNPWAHFKMVLVGDVRKFRFETSDPKVIERLEGIPGVTRAEETAPDSNAAAPAPGSDAPTPSSPKAQPKA